ncbi:MAG: hypothetical protein ACJAZZ_001487 [Dokdonia donghaensis]|jgi:hypothetical protein
MNHSHWSAFNFILSENINTNINEQLFENKVIQAFGELGWKEYLGNIEVRPTLHIGSVNRIEPDLLFKSDEAKNLFVIEVKRPGIDLNIDYQKQLFSYMRQLKLDYGILIGKEIQVFYDGNLYKSDTPLMLEKITFTKENQKGERFVELFSKSKFNFESLNKFTQNKLVQIDKRKQSVILKKLLLSDEFKNNAITILKENLLNEYDSETLDKVFDELNIEIKDISQKPITHISPTAYLKRKNLGNRISNSDKRRKDGVKIGEYVQKTFRRFTEKNQLSNQEIANLLREDYSKQVFGNTWKVLRQTAEGTKDNLGNNRYYTREIFAGNYYLTSQWNERHWDAFLDWEKRIESKN